MNVYFIFKENSDNLRKSKLILMILSILMLPILL